MKNKILISSLLLCSHTLTLAQEKLKEVEVLTTPENNHISDNDISLSQSGGSSASLIEKSAGVHLQAGGGLSSLPIIHGMNDDRVNVKIDGAQLTSSCPNHMNPVLSSIDPTKISEIETLAGITPVSAGGDSIGGSIIVKSKAPEFAGEDQETKKKLKLSSFFKSNNENRGAAIDIGVATKKLSLNYSGLDEAAHNYRNGDGKRVKGTLFNQNNQTVVVGGKLDSGIVSLKLARSVIPYSGFVNQPMDMNDNVTNSENLGYKGEIGALNIDANIFHSHTNHYMNIITSQRSGNMPMYTRSDESGYNLKFAYDLSQNHILKFGSDYDKYHLEDWWPAVSGSMMMSPGTFKSIANGKRKRLGLFIEADSSWSSDFSSNIGFRTDIVKMDTGNVTGYSTSLPADAVSFNSKNHEKKDHNYDATILTNYKMTENSDFEFGLAQKTRSPNLYERYAWDGTSKMSMSMINWFGDANGYVGNLNLKPEIAHTISTTLSLHDKNQKDWGMKFTPYYTQVENFIDIDLVTTNNNSNYLRFANHDAIIFGADMSGNAKLVDTENFGSFKLKTIASYTRGYRKDGKSNLYHLMPLNAKIALEHQIGKWTSEVSGNFVTSKKQTSKLRLEPETAGYALLDLGTSYQASKLIKIDFGISNILDHQYGLPLGGVDHVNYAKSTRTPVSGMGRSINSSVTIDFF